MSVGQLLADLANRGVHVWRDGDRLRFRAPDGAALDDGLLETLRSRRDAIFDLLAAVGPAAASRPIVKAPEGAAVRCSHAQERFLFSAELEGSSGTYQLNAGFRIRGALDAAALERSIADLVRRHDGLRSRFTPDAAGFVIETTDWTPALQIVDFTGSEDDLLRALGREAPIEFDLRRGPHLAARLFRLAADHCVLFIAMHHIVSDGGSIAVMAREIHALYAWRTGAAPDPPPEPLLQYRDFAFSERSGGDGAEAESLAFWKDDLASAPAVLALPADRPRPARRLPSGASIALAFEPSLLQRLEEVRIARRLTHFQIVTAALALMLHKYSGQSSLVIGTPWRNRERPGAEDIIGPLLNLLPIHLRFETAATIGGLLAETRARTLAAMAHGGVAFERIVSHLRPERSASYTPVFQVMCAVETTPVEAAQLPGLSVEPLDLPNDAARYDLALVLQHSGGALRGALKYDRALFDEATAVRLARHFRSALRLVLGDPSLPLARAQLMDDAERAQMLVAWNATERAYPLHRTLVDAFADAAAAAPERIAVECEGRSLSYSALDAWSNRLAHRLRGIGVGRGDFVGIAMARSLEMVVAILAILKAGAAYVPVDSDHPPERRLWVLRDAGVKAVIGPDHIAGLGVPQLAVGDPQEHDRPATAVDSRPHPQDACYVIYTSGSTGLPKGVITDHAAIANNLYWMNDEWPLTADDAVLFKSSPGFDVSVKEILWPLIAGARLVVARQGGQGDPEYLCDLIRSRRVSVAHMVPTMLDFFLRHETASNLPNLRIVMCGGETLTPALRARFHQAFDALLLHLYGPTEAAIAVTGYAIAPHHAEAARLPLGRPMPNCRIYVLDSAQQPVPVGVAGELCIAGVPLARGYLARPDLTAEKFVPDPFAAGPGTRLYRTGDLARWRADGQLEYLGRIDRQIKVRGFRIEPGEIEAALRAQPGIDDALVVAREHSLLAYVASRASDLPTDAIQQTLRARFPAFMVPASFVVVPEFPRNMNGKIDQAALPEHSAPSAPQAGAAPRGALEEQVAHIWCDLLGLESADRDENFFDLGGHSLLVLQLQARLRDELGHAVSVADLFLWPTVAGLVAHISQSKLRRATRWLKRTFSLGRGFGS